MTAAEWASSTDVPALLEALSALPEEAAPPARFHAFARECARRVRHLLGDAIRAVADELREKPRGDPTPAWQVFWREFNADTDAARPRPGADARAAAGAAVRRSAAFATGMWMQGRPYSTARMVAWHAARAAELADRMAAYPAAARVPAGVLDHGDTPASPAERAAQAGLVRCVFGNPFAPAAFDPGWRTEAVVGLARGIDADAAYDRLPVLADALEDAGCADAELLAHCRGGGLHAPGCHAIDRALGRW